MQTIAPVNTDRVWLRTFFMDDYLFFKGSLCCLSIVFWCYRTTAWIKLWKSWEAIWQKGQTQYRTSKFFEGIFQACQKFCSNPLPEYHFVVSTMTTWGFLSMYLSKTDVYDLWLYFVFKLLKFLMSSLIWFIDSYIIR